jgi:hypothetical protein
MCACCAPLIGTGIGDLGYRTMRDAIDLALFD